MLRISWIQHPHLKGHTSKLPSIIAAALKHLEYTHTQTQDTQSPTGGQELGACLGLMHGRGLSRSRRCRDGVCRHLVSVCLEVCRLKVCRRLVFGLSRSCRGLILARTSCLSLAEYCSVECLSWSHAGAERCPRRHSCASQAHPPTAHDPPPTKRGKLGEDTVVISGSWQLNVIEGGLVVHSSVWWCIPGGAFLLAWWCIPRRCIPRW